MKLRKVLSLLLVSMLVLSAISVSAAEKSGTGQSKDDPVVFSKDDIDESAFEGAWFETGNGFDVYLPAKWEVQEVTEENAAKGLQCLIGNPGGGANITVTHVAQPDGYDIDAMYKELTAKNYATLVYSDMNGVPGVAFDDLENYVGGFMTILDGEVVTFIVSPPSNDEYEAFAPSMKNILSSISYSEKEE